MGKRQSEAKSARTMPLDKDGKSLSVFGHDVNPLSHLFHQCPSASFDVRRNLTMTVESKCFTCSQKSANSSHGAARRGPVRPCTALKIELHRRPVSLPAVSTPRRGATAPSLGCYHFLVSASSCYRCKLGSKFRQAGRAIASLGVGLGLMPPGARAAVA